MLHFSVSPRPLGFGFWVCGFWVWGLGLTIVWHFVLAVLTLTWTRESVPNPHGRPDVELLVTKYSRETNLFLTKTMVSKGFKMLKHWRFKNPAIRDPKSFNYVAKTWNWLFCRSGLLVPMYLSEEERTMGRQFQPSQDLFDSFYPSLLSKPSLSRWLTDEDKNFMS